MTGIVWLRMAKPFGIAKLLSIPSGISHLM